MEVRSQHFAAGARAALEDTHLQRALAEATGRLRDQRAQAFADFPPGEALRAEARRIVLTMSISSIKFSFTGVHVGCTM